jgi:outer membrane protein OmpA-like peptidoglycan-associated protein
MFNRSALLCGRLAFALAAPLALTAAATAQSVQMFEETPSLEQLRNVLVPESTGGASRGIVIRRPAEQSPPQKAQDVPRRSEEGARKIEMAPPSAPQSPARNEPADAATPALSTAAPPSPSMQGASTPVQPPRPMKPSSAAGGIVGVRINFAVNSAAIPESSAPLLDRLALLLQQEEQLTLLVEGHTDAVGGHAYNLSLSQRRAQAVMAALEQRGVPRDRLAVAGKGKAEPLFPDPYDGRNRRVQFVRLD